MSNARTTSNPSVHDEKAREIRIDADPIPPRLIALARALEAALRAYQESSAAYPCKEGTHHQ